MCGRGGGRGRQDTALAKSWACARSASLIDVQAPPMLNRSSEHRRSRNEPLLPAGAASPPANPPSMFLVDAFAALDALCPAPKPSLRASDATYGWFSRTGS